MAKKEKEEEVKTEPTPAPALEPTDEDVIKAFGNAKIRFEGIGMYIEFPAPTLCALQNIAECPRVRSFIERCKKLYEDPRDFSMKVIPACQQWCANYTRIDLPVLLQAAKPIQEEEKK